MSEPSPETDFLRDRDVIAKRLTSALHEDPGLDQHYSDEAWNTVTGLAWRPAWSIRSRRGSLRPLLDWWRGRRARRAQS